MTRIVDRRKFVLVHPRGRTRPVGTRSRRDIDAVVLHQMSFTRGEDPTRYDPTTSHFAVLMDGTILRLHDPETLLHSSNGFNRRSVAVEFCGVFPNERGRYHRASASRYGRHTLSVAQAEGGRKLLDIIRAELGITHVFTHRQANYPTKANCPGPHIWYNVGEWGVRTGLSDGGPGFHLAGGRPIPDAWRDAALDVFPSRGP